MFRDSTLAWTSFSKSLPLELTGNYGNTNIESIDWERFVTQSRNSCAFGNSELAYIFEAIRDVLLDADSQECKPRTIAV